MKRNPTAAKTELLRWDHLASERRSWQRERLLSVESNYNLDAEDSDGEVVAFLLPPRQQWPKFMLSPRPSLLSVSSCYPGCTIFARHYLIVVQDITNYCNSLLLQQWQHLQQQPHQNPQQGGQQQQRPSLQSDQSMNQSNMDQAQLQQQWAQTQLPYGQNAAADMNHTNSTQVSSVTPLMLFLFPPSMPIFMYPSWESSCLRSSPPILSF